MFPLASMAVTTSSSPTWTVPTSSARPTGTARTVGSDTDCIIGKWFKRTGKRNEISLATKFGFVDTISDPPTNKVRTDPENVFASCESS